MTSKKKLSKYSLDPLIFSPEPPVAPSLVKRLFHGREREYERGLLSLKAGLDLEGKRSKKSDKLPWVIHGESRSGKSHLARRIFATLPDTDTRLQFRIPAVGRLDAINVIRPLFEELRGRFLNRILNQKLEHDPLRRPQVQLVKQLIEKIGLFEPGVQSATLSAEQSESESVESGLELGGAPLLAKFIGKFQSERSQKAGVQLLLRQPTVADLAEVCGIMVETLLGQKLIRHALILMDDVDLLEAYLSPEQNARNQRYLLADACRILHHTPGIDVVLTTRSWYYHSQKELQTLVDLTRAGDIPNQEMLGIFDKRVEFYAPRAFAFLTREALEELAGDVNGLPGVFLKHVQTAFYQYQNQEDEGARDYGWVLNFFSSHLELLRDKCAPGYDAMVAAVNQNRLHVDVTKHNPFFGTVLENEYAYQSYYNERTYFLSGIVRKVLKRPEVMS